MLSSFPSTFTLTGQRPSEFYKFYNLFINFPILRKHSFNVFSEIEGLISSDNDTFVVFPSEF